jgi:hypothetical protein
MKMKKLLSVLLAVIMVFGMVPSTLAVENDTATLADSETLYYLWVTGGVAIVDGQEVYKAAAGDKVYLSVAEGLDGTVFSHWVVDFGAVELQMDASGIYYFIMPGEMVSISAAYTGALHSVEVFDIEIPTAGACPDYTATVSADGYELYHKDGVGINGIVWCEVFDEYSQRMQPEDVFEEGHTYCVSVMLRAKDGYFFYKNEYGSVDILSYINTDYAEVSGIDEDTDHYISLSVYYTVPKSRMILVEGGKAYKSRSEEIPENEITSINPYDFVKIIADDKENFSHWEVVNGSVKLDDMDLHSPMALFSMPDENVHIRAVYYQTVSAVELTVIAPIGNRPAQCADTVYSAQSEYYMADMVYWMDLYSDDGRIMDETELFQCGQSYLGHIVIRPIEGFRFNTDFLYVNVDFAPVECTLHEDGTITVDLIFIAKHSTYIVPGVPPTCTESGVKDHWVCELCGSMFADQQGTNQIWETEIAEPCHDWQHGECGTPLVCARCGEDSGELNGHIPGQLGYDEDCHWHICEYCSAVIEDTVNNHVWGDNSTCFYCGFVASREPVIPILTGKSFSLSFEDEILVNYYFTAENTEDVLEMGMLVFYEDPGVNPDFTDADGVYWNYQYNETTGIYSATTVGISAKEMGDTRYYCAYAILYGGKCVFSKVYDYSPRKYAMNMLGRASTSDKQKALCVAMLNYGAAAQNFFDYRTDDLMNAGLTAEQKAMVITYDETYFTGAVAADPGKVGVFASSGTGFSGKSASVSFEGAFSINYYFIPSNEVSGDLLLYIWTPDAYAQASTLSVENASEILTMDCFDGIYWGQISGIAAKSLDETYYVAGVYTDELGNTHYTGIIPYSLSKYCMNNAKPGKDMQELAAATAMYGYYAKEFFTK